MTVRVRWNSGIAYAVFAFIAACFVGYDLSDGKKLGLLVIMGCMSLSAVCFASALEQQERERR